MSFDELKYDLEKKGIESYRAEQIYRWISKGVKSFNNMTNIPKSIREMLDSEYTILSTDIEHKLISKVDGTVKYVFRLFDGQLIESVLMKYNHGYSMCISTQVGCKMKCGFCATGKGGFFRNLEPSEMISQIQSAQEDYDIRISNVVLMGMGEPLDNYENTLKFLELVSSDHGLNIGMRHISLSTCGIVDKIYSLADKELQMTLSISLHAPSDKIRSGIMPVSKRWTVNEVINACKYYILKTKRRISFEYSMINGVNDSDSCAHSLSRLLKGMICHVNLISVNEIEEGGFLSSSRNRIEHFKQILLDNGINATIRRTLGPDINASCGQLRGRFKEEGSRVENI